MNTIKGILIKFQEYQLENNILNANFAHNAIANNFLKKYPEILNITEEQIGDEAIKYSSCLDFTNDKMLNEMGREKIVQWCKQDFITGAKWTLNKIYDNTSNTYLLHNLKQIFVTEEEIGAIQNAWKLVRNKITGGTNEENKKLEQDLDYTLSGLRTLKNKMKIT